MAHGSGGVLVLRAGAYLLRLLYVGANTFLIFFAPEIGIFWCWLLGCLV